MCCTTYIQVPSTSATILTRLVSKVLLSGRLIRGWEIGGVSGDSVCAFSPAVQTRNDDTDQVLSEVHGASAYE